MHGTCAKAARWVGRFVIALGVSCTMTTLAGAVPITYSFSGTATGTLGATPFTGAALTITAVGDTAGVAALGSGVFCNHLTSVTFGITGAGSGSVTDPFDIFDATANGALGLTRGASCPGGNDWVDVSAAAFTTYHLDTGTGAVPLVGPSTIQFSANTSLGTLTFSSVLMTTFQATLSAPVATGSLENPQPGSPQSGIGLISGWACPPVTRIQVAFDGGAMIPVPYGSPRLDTAAVCAGQTNSGYGLLFNYNTLGPGSHTATAYADGSPIGTAQFAVTTLGAEFLTGAHGSLNINNFPSAGKRALLTWQQATQNFAIESNAGTPPPVAGNYVGAIVGTESNCGTSNGPIFNNNVQFGMNQSGDAITVVLTLNPSSSPSSCTLSGTLQYNVGGTQHILQGGAYTCNDGSSGSWSSNVLAFTNAGFSAQSTLTAGNGCVATLKMAGARNP